jgi:lipopolysaccharide/colanic/teichoic acid biosynthesis glycosyltransferase
MSNIHNKLRIVVAVTVPISWVFFGKELKYLRHEGFEITAISSPGKRLEAISQSEGASALAIPMEREIRPLKDLVSLWRIYRALRRIKPDLVDMSTPKAGLLVGLASVFARIPCRIYTLRGLRFETSTGPKRALLWLAERVSCACANRVVPISESLRQLAVQMKIVKPAKSAILARSSNGVDVDRFNPNLRDGEQCRVIRDALGINRNEHVIGFVGRFVKDKGIYELLEAFRQLSISNSNLRLLMVGDFESGDPISPQIREAIISDPHILRSGFVEDTAPYYALMDVLVFPTYREGFGNVSLEAQASGVPVVTTNATGSKDSVQDGVTGWLVTVKDVQGLAAAIESLLRDPQRRAEMGVAGRQWMEREFRPELIWRARVKMYRELIHEHSQRPQHLRRGHAIKRAIDILSSAAGLVVLSPVMGAIALAVCLSMGAPVVFRQTRPGFHAEPFTLLKFRTMRDANDAEGLPLADADRLTRVGTWLRKLSLDELPQLWNVLRGDLSLVGPRPLLMEYLERYTPEQARRHDVMPGITGWTQVNGRNALTWEQKFVLDTWYVDHWAIWLDLRILAKTLVHVTKPTGISNSGHATMPEFLGTNEGTAGNC